MRTIFAGGLPPSLLRNFLRKCTKHLEATLDTSYHCKRMSLQGSASAALQTTCHWVAIRESLLDQLNGQDHVSPFSVGPLLSPPFIYICWNNAPRPEHIHFCVTWFGVWCAVTRNASRHCKWADPSGVIWISEALSKCKPKVAFNLLPSRAQIQAEQNSIKYLQMASKATVHEVHNTRLVKCPTFDTSTSISDIGDQLHPKHPNAKSQKACVGTTSWPVKRVKKSDAKVWQLPQRRCRYTLPKISTVKRGAINDGFQVQYILVYSKTTYFQIY